MDFQDVRQFKDFCEVDIIGKKIIFVYELWDGYIIQLEDKSYIYFSIANNDNGSANVTTENDYNCSDSEECSIGLGLFTQEEWNDRKEREKDKQKLLAREFRRQQYENLKKEFG